MIVLRHCKFTVLGVQGEIKFPVNPLLNILLVQFSSPSNNIIDVIWHLNRILNPRVIYQIVEICDRADDHSTHATENGFCVKPTSQSLVHSLTDMGLPILIQVLNVVILPSPPFPILSSMPTHYKGIFFSQFLPNPLTSKSVSRDTFS